jgi:OOP family OmpA-OmpF porin
MAPAKIFGGRAQYRTWTLGVNGGFTVPSVIIGGVNDFGRSPGNSKGLQLGDYKLGAYYGLSLRKQFGHVFGLQANLNRGHVISKNEGGTKSGNTTVGFYEKVETDVQYDASLQGFFNLATIDFLNRENAINFYLTAGYGLIAYNPVYYSTLDGPVTADPKGTHGGAGDNNDYAREAYIPVGLGVKFKLSDRVALDLGYEMKFIDTDYFDGVYANQPSNDKFSYTHAGLEFSLGSKAKPDLNWVNPVAMMYDELKDPTLRQEVEALKGRVSNLEQSVEDLKKDSDGDGVADYLDKCPNTPAGAKVDGAGCELDTDGDGIPDWKDKCPTEKGTAELNGCPEMSTATMTGVNNIQFEYNSSVLRTSSYPTLDKVSSSMRATPGMKLQLDGHASAEGTDAYNMQLSIDRANAVKTYLVNSGVDAKNIATKGYGETRPIASNATEEGRIANRRVEFRQQ